MLCAFCGTFVPTRFDRHRRRCDGRRESNVQTLRGQLKAATDFLTAARIRERIRSLTGRPETEDDGEGTSEPVVRAALA